MFRTASAVLSRGNSVDAGTVPGTADSRQTVRIHIEGTAPDVTTQSSNEDADTFHQVYQTQPTSHQQTPYYQSSLPATVSNVSVRGTFGRITCISCFHCLCF